MAGRTVVSTFGDATSWYTPDKHDPEVFGSAQSIFDEAIKRFKYTQTEDEKKRQWLDNLSSASLHDVERAVLDAKARYEDKKQFKIRSYLADFAKRVHYYGKIMDMLAQQHPEYVSLAWGAMKLLFVAVVNQEQLLSTLANGLSRIADELPGVELSASLYPTKQMWHAVASLYAYIIKFLMRALDWYKESRLLHLVHSITRPAELRYNDLIEEISYSTRRVKDLASASSQAELRDMHTEVNELKSHIVELKSHIIELKVTISTTQSINASAHIEFRQALSDIQLNQALTMASAGSLIDPVKSLQCSLFMRSRRNLKSTAASEPFWFTPKVQSWNLATVSSLVMIKGTFRSRFQIKDFCTNVVELLRYTQVPVVWVLKTIDSRAEQDCSTIDLLKHLVLQVLRLNCAIQTDFALSRRLRMFSTATTEDDWFSLLGSVLEGLPQVYFVIDIEMLSSSLPNITQDFSWPLAFLGLFQKMSDRGLKTIVKAILFSYGSPVFLQTTRQDVRDLVVPVGGVLSSKRMLRRQVPSVGLKSISIGRGRGRDRGQRGRQFQ